METDLETLLDADLQDFVDMPEFPTPPAGVYAATLLGMTTKEIKDQPAVEVKVKLDSTVELADETETPIADGTEVSVAYTLTNEYGQGGFKAIATVIAGMLGVTTTREVMEGCAGLELVIVTKLAKDKKDPEKKYFRIDSILEE